MKHHQGLINEAPSSDGPYASLKIDGARQPCLRVVDEGIIDKREEDDVDSPRLHDVTSRGIV